MKSKKLAILVAQFNPEITSSLLECCVETLKKNGVSASRIEVKSVPGAYELPFVAHQLAKSKKYSGIIALGCVIKGETNHDRHVAGWASTGLGLTSLLTGVPCFFGVLTPNTEQQALERAKPGPLNRGEEVALAALDVLGWKR